MEERFAIFNDMFIFCVGSSHKSDRLFSFSKF